MEKRLQFQQPAKDFLEALPVGNGSLGGMVYGEFPHGHITLNKDDFWSGNGKKDIHDVKQEQMDTLRNLIFQGRLEEAEKMTTEEMISSGFSQSYMPIGSLRYFIEQQGEIQEYRRWLDMEQGVARTYVVDEARAVTIETFVSYPDDVMIVHIKSSKKNGINMTATMDCPLKHQLFSGEENKVVMNIEAPYHGYPNYIEKEKYLLYNDTEQGLRSSSVLGVWSPDGQITLNGVVYMVELASEVTLVLGVKTGYNGYEQPLTTDFSKLSQPLIEHMDTLKEKNYIKIYKEHIKDWQRLYNRVEFDIDEAKENPKIQKALLYFHFGRYLMMASSREGSQPTTLQGIWSEKPRPEWSSNYTLNINTPMNYWMANVCNLYECEEPLVTLLKDLSQSGQETASRTYCSNGWAASHNTDLWRMTAPVNVGPKHGYWPMGGVWLTAHLYNRYRYSLDKEYLLNEAYPIMKGAAEFCLGWLCKNPEGQLHICPSTSPENSFYDADGKNCSVTFSSAMDIGLVKELFQNILEIHETYNVDSVFAQQVKEAYGQLPEYQIGTEGQLLEWYDDYEEFEPGHRHFSPLYGLFPGQTIHEYDRPEYINACEKLLEKRMEAGGGHTGWSAAWLINLYARLGKGEKAVEYVDYLLEHMTAPNFFDLHPPLGLTVNESEVFQIDGNFGATSGIAMMLIQSILDEIRLLPALPTAWKNGYVKGLRAINGCEVDMFWRQGRLTEATLYVMEDGCVKIKTAEQIHVFWEDEKIPTERDEKGRQIFQVQCGKKYRLKVLERII